MSKARIDRIARLVSLRTRQRRLRQAGHAAAQQELDRAAVRQQDCAASRDALDREHDDSVRGEVDPLDLELLGQARTRADHDLRAAESEVSRANELVRARREELLAAHRAQRALEIFHGKVLRAFEREVLLAEQRELDDIAALYARSREGG